MTGLVCVYCGKRAQGKYSIHRDGFGVGPEVPLCNAHGSRELPTCEQIWDRIARRRHKAETLREAARICDAYGLVKMARDLNALASGDR